MEVFQLGNWESATDMDELHEMRAQRESLELEKRTLPKIMALDDHALHIKEHTRYALSAEFRRLQERRPEMAVAMLAHIDGHKQLAVEQAMAMQGAAQDVAQGEEMAQALNRQVINKSTNLSGSLPGGGAG